MDPEAPKQTNSHVSNDFGVVHSGLGNGAELKPVQTSGSITVTPEMFERMYLSPENRVKGELRRTLGNPTPVGLGGFLVAYSPIIFALLGWRGTGKLGASTVGNYYFGGGLLAILACVGEFLLGNSFPAVFFGVYGAFFLAFGATLTPAYNAYLAYAPPSSANQPVAVQAAEGMMDPGFLAGIGFWSILYGVFSLYCTICALRTNILFTAAFFFLVLAFFLFAGSNFTAGQGKTALSHTLQIAAGSVGFVTLIIGWYLLLALMLTTVDFPIQLPVGDLSHIIKGASELQREKRRRERGDDIEKQE